MSGYVPSRTRTCAYSYVNEKDLPPGQKLLNCGKCKETCYIDRASQKAHWRLHKETCQPVERDDSVALFEAMDFSDPSSSLESITSMLRVMFTNGQTVFKGRIILCYLRQLRLTLIDPETYQHYSEEQVMKEVHHTATVLQQCVIHGGSSYIQRMLGIPGFVNYIFSDELLLTPEMQRRKEIGLSGPYYVPLWFQWKRFIPEACYPSEDEIYQGPENFDRLKHLPRAYCVIIEQLFSTLLFQLKPFGFWADQRSRHLCCALTKLLLQCWTCPYTTVSFPAYKEPPDISMQFGSCRSKLFSLLLQTAFGARMDSCETIHAWIWKEPRNVLPGLGVCEMLTALVIDKSLIRDLLVEQKSDTCKQFIPYFALCTYYNDGFQGDGDSQQDRGGPWIFFHAKNRVIILDLLVMWNPPSSLVTSQGHPLRSVLIFFVLGGNCTRIFLQICQSLKRVEGCVDPRTLRLIHVVYEQLRRKVQPSLTIALQLVEDNSTKQTGETISLPADLEKVIAEHAFPLQQMADFTTPGTPIHDLLCEME